MPASRQYEIDGLRCLAVLSVVLYHADFPFIRGGFVGVDVFFVISGYLITRIIVDEIAANQFSIMGFYERRARRILPAFVAMVVVTSLGAVFLLLPSELVRFAKSLLSADLFVSNIFFYDNAGYFDAAANSYPLLHTWSLAVEEQFYIVFPLSYFLATKVLGRRAIWLVAIVGVASFATSIATTPSNPTFAFYLPFTRAWELAAGSVIALVPLRRVTRGPRRQSLATLSLATISISVVLIPDDGHFPGWIAIFPVLGAAGLILTASDTWVGTILRHPVAVGIGRISYSFYLWHWPLLLLAATWLIRPLDLLESSLVVLFALGLSGLSWRFVEQPFRTGLLPRPRQVFIASGAAIALIAIFCLVCIGLKGLPWRVPEEPLRLAAYQSDISPMRTHCHDRSGSVPVSKACALGSDAPPTIAVWSDSHGVELAYALSKLAASNGRSVMQLSSSACPPGISNSTSNRSKCTARNREVLDYLLAEPSIQTIIIAAARGNDDLDSVRSSFGALERAIRPLRDAGRTVVLEYPLYRDTMSVPLRLAYEQWFRGKREAIAFPIDTYFAKLRNTIAATDDLVRRYGLEFVRPTDALCPEKMCRFEIDGKPLFFDSHHPSLSAETLIAPLYMKYLN